MRVRLAAPVRPVRQRLVEPEPHAHRHMPHVAPRGRLCRRARGPEWGLIQPGRGDVGNEGAQLSACGRVREDGAGTGSEAHADRMPGADRLASCWCACGGHGSVCMRSTKYWKKKRRGGDGWSGICTASAVRTYILKNRELFDNRRAVACYREVDHRLHRCAGRGGVET